MPDSSVEAREETRFILSILVESDAVDLDVLADAYIKVESLLSENQKTVYKNYFKKQYYKDKEYILNNFERLKTGYENSEGIKKRKFLFEGRHLLKIEAVQKN